jgi:hypothetical protein
LLKRSRQIDPLDFYLTATDKALLLELSKVHPARDVLEKGLNPSIYTSVPQQLKFLSFSDAPLLLPTIDEVAHSGARQKAALYEVESEKELFF